MEDVYLILLLASIPASEGTILSLSLLTVVLIVHILLIHIIILRCIVMWPSLSLIFLEQYMFLAPKYIY